MGDICSPSNSSSRGPDTGAFIQCINGRYSQIHEFWCWDIYGIFREVHPTSRVEILDRTVGYFFTKYLSKSGQHNHIIGELLINGSVPFIGLSNIWGSGLTYIPNLLDLVEDTGWVSSSNDCNKIWGGSFTDPTSMTNVPWGGSVNTYPDYFLRCPASPCVALH